MFFFPCRHLKPELSNFEHVIMIEYLGFLLSRFPIVILLSSTVELYLIWVYSELERRTVKCLACSWDKTPVSKYGWLSMRRSFNSPDCQNFDWHVLSNCGFFRSLCCTQGGNARCRTNLDRIDPVRASGLHQLWHEVGVERASLWVFPSVLLVVWPLPLLVQ